MAQRPSIGLRSGEYAGCFRVCIQLASRSLLAALWALSAGRSWGCYLFGGLYRPRTLNLVDKARKNLFDVVGLYY